MKKYLCLIICFIIVFLCPIKINANDQYEDQQYDYFSSSISDIIYSTRSTTGYIQVGGSIWIPAQSVNLSMPNSNSTVQAWLTLSEMSDAEMAAVQNANIGADYPNATIYLAGSETARYNCHSYAWYSRDIDTNHYWIDDPSPYYKYGSYCVVDVPQIGDIICYFDDNGTPNDETDDVNLHSGIVIGRTYGQSNNLCGNSDKVTVRSKWGVCGIYDHNGYECPYTSYSTEPGKKAEYVKYYRFNAHTYPTGTYYNEQKHYQTCEECGYSSLGEHNYAHVQHNDDQHYAVCIQCAYSYLQNHDLFYEPASSTQHAVICDMCGYIGLRNHELDSSGRCTLCGYN